MQIRLISKSNKTEEIIKKITNSSFEASLVNSTNNVTFQILSKDSSKGTLQLQLKFSNPESISNSLDLDTIRMVVPEKIIYKNGFSIL